jgi:hypothetical protein
MVETAAEIQSNWAVKNHMTRDDVIFIEFGFFRNVSSLKISNV